jgi:class 3 adenylate cyclase
MTDQSRDATAPAPLERKLATILSADIAEYSRLMAEDEEQTLLTFRGHSEVFASLVSLHRGRIFNTAGDAILAEFGSAVEAVRCATEIQAALQTRNNQFPENRQVRFRIGVNLGDVMVQGNDLLGDGVNVAARLQSAAEPGGICLSGSVYDQIRNKLSLGFQSLGEKSFKNIPQPVRTFCVTTTEGHEPLPSPATAATPQRRGLALAWIVGAVAIAVMAGGVWAYSALRPGAPTAVPVVAAATPPEGASLTAAIDGLYAGPVCYGPGTVNNQPARCYPAQATIEQGKITGKWTGVTGATMVLNGIVSAAGAVQIELHAQNTEGGRSLTADLSGTLQDGKLDATGTFRSGRTATINWRRDGEKPAP